MANLSLCHVTKNYHSHPVIQGISVEIQDGEMVVVVGPSGCGKTTLLRMIAGLEEISSGEIKINNKIVNHLEPKNRDIAMVFQNYALYPHMTVYNNMAYGLKMRGFKKSEIAIRVQKVAETLAITHILDRVPKQLSGGQRQRVAMGRAMVREPAIFLFDEPLSNLDTKLRVQMRLEIKQLQRQFRTTSIYVTHDQVEAMTMGDRLIVMNHGVVEQIGTPLEIYQKPATRFVAGFIGSPAMNFMRAELKNEKKILELPNGTRLAYQNENLKHQLTTNLFLGIRPESFIPSQKKINKKNVLTVVVNQIESLGSDTLLHGTLLHSEQALTVRMPGDWQANINDQIPFTVDPNDLHFFDCETEKRIE